MNKYITLIIIIFLIYSCSKPKSKDVCSPDFFQLFSENQIAPIKHNENFYFFLNPIIQNGKCGYFLICYTGLNNKVTFFSYCGFLYCFNNILYTSPLGTNKSYQLLDFKGNNNNQKIIIKKPYGIIDIKYHGAIKSGTKYYRENIFTVRFSNIVYAYENLFGDIVFFVGKNHGIVGIYFSVIMPNSHSDKNNRGKEIIYHIQGDILLHEINYYNSAVFGRNTFYCNTFKPYIDSVGNNEIYNVNYNVTFFRKNNVFPLRNYPKDVWSNY